MKAVCTAEADRRAQRILDPRFASGDLRVDGSRLADSTLEIRRRALSRDHDGAIFLPGENLGDQACEYRVGYPVPGRTGQLGIEPSF